MYGSIQTAAAVFVQFYEMVSPAQCTQASGCPVLVEMSVAVQPGCVKIFIKTVDFFPDTKTGRNIFSNHSIQLLKFHFFLLDSCQCNAAADINPHKIWQDAPTHGHGKSDGSHFTRMNIRHHPDLTSSGGRVVTNHLDLSQCIGVWAVSEYFSRREDSIYCFHLFLLFASS